LECNFNQVRKILLKLNVGDVQHTALIFGQLRVLLTRIDQARVG